MRSFLFVGMICFFTAASFAQAPSFTRNYTQLGISAGYATGEKEGGFTLGAVHGIVIGSYWIYEGSASHLAFFNEESASTDLLVINLATIDIGFGTTLFTNNFYFGVVPFSINWTQSPGYGIAVMAKYRLSEFVLEGKLMPYTYSDNEYNILDYNSYAGLQYWPDEDFSIGLRLHRYDFYTHFNVMFSWNFVH